MKSGIAIAPIPRQMGASRFTIDDADDAAFTLWRLLCELSAWVEYGLNDDGEFSLQRLGLLATVGNIGH